MTTKFGIRKLETWLYRSLHGAKWISRTV